MEIFDVQNNNPVVLEKISQMDTIMWETLDKHMVYDENRELM